MIQRQVFRLVVLVACAHGLVHLYELSLPSVEQEIACEFYPDNPQTGKELSGTLSNYWRLLWGLGALVAGWLVDRFGGRSMLAIYLIGCGVACFLASSTTTTVGLTTGMLIMGGFASIYHPAGLALIANETTPENRPRALGFHGILGSVGIGISPLLAWIVMQMGFTWRNYFALLAIPGIALGGVFVFTAIRHSQRSGASTPQEQQRNAAENHAHWIAFVTLTVLAFLQGFVYAAQMSFLPRYLSSQEHVGAKSLAVDNEGSTQSSIDSESAANSESSRSNLDAASRGKLFASIALLLGCIGQYLAGRFARHDRLELQIAMITLANVPFLAWMAFATGWSRVLAACLFALVHFMHQPIYNSLIPKYTPRRIRSLCYGVSISIGLGCGSFGARFAGAYMDDFVVYGTLAGVSTAATGVGLLLWWLQDEVGAPRQPDSTAQSS